MNDPKKLTAETVLSLIAELAKDDEEALRIAKLSDEQVDEEYAAFQAEDAKKTN